MAEICPSPGPQTLVGFQPGLQPWRPAWATFFQELLDQTIWWVFFSVTSNAENWGRKSEDRPATSSTPARHFRVPPRVAFPSASQPLRSKLNWPIATTGLAGCLLAPKIKISRPHTLSGLDLRPGLGPFFWVHRAWPRGRRRRWNPAWPRSRKLSGLKAPWSDRIDDMIAALLPNGLPQHSSPTLLWDTSLHTSLQPPLRHLSKTPCPTISTTLLYQIHPQHFPTTLLSNIVQQQYPNQPIPASRKHKNNTDQHDPALQSAKTPCNPGLQTTLDCKHMFTQTSVTLDCKHIHTQTVQRPARPWIEKHTQNTQTSTTLDCKHPKSTQTPARPWNANSQKQYRDRHDPGLQHTEQKNRFSRNKNNHAQIRPKIMHLEQNRQKKAATYNAKYDGTDAFSEHAFSGFSVFVTCSCSVAAALKSPCTFWWFSFCREVSCCFCVRRCETVAGTSFYEIKRIHGIIIFSRAKSQRKGL